MSNTPGRLYVVATPIGNRADMTERARSVLAEVDVVAAEDTRHTGRLLAEWGVRPRMLSLHEHNEHGRIKRLHARIQGGESVALVSDAGTPLISDPGYGLVRELRRQGVDVRVVPGPCSVTAALSVAGLPTDRFVFEGFLPAKSQARQTRLRTLVHEERSMVVFEAGHRIRASLADMMAAFGDDREAAVCRELTKAYETVRLAPLAELVDWVTNDPDQRRGEFVVVIAGREARAAENNDADSDRVLAVLAAELPTKQAANLAARITGRPRNELYSRALAQRAEDD